MGHELAHQWTGNLVTCQWWDELWLNKAFSDVLGYMSLRYSEPEWNWESEFTNYELYEAFDADASVNSRPLVNKQNNNDHVVESPLEIARQFDHIVYGKGGAITRMVMHAMGEHRWQSGMKDYLQTNQERT